MGYLNPLRRWVLLWIDFRGKTLGRQWLGVLIECLPLGSFCHTENLAILGGFARCALVGVAVGQRDSGI